MATDQKIKNALFILRLGVFIVMFMWTLDKFINPEHAARVFETFYFISGAGELAFYIIGSIQLIIIGAFVGAYKRQYSYLAVLIMHAISTLSSFGRYLDPWTSPKEALNESILDSSRPLVPDAALPPASLQARARCGENAISTLLQNQ